MSDHDSLEGIAIIGMACRFPGAENIKEYWDNIVNGRESIHFYTNEELEDALTDKALLYNKKYIKARGDLSDIETFDAAFFGISPKEAALMDPQHRFGLECAWHALEDAGYDSDRYKGRIGVFAGESMNSYLVLNVLPSITDKYATLSTLQAAIGNDKDSLTTTISYKMNLTGASITVQSSSSTSLTAICVACQSILSYQCDMAIAGGVSIGVPQKSGYFYEEGGIQSKDGHCRPFDYQSSGFVPGNGVGMVVLKRLDEAVSDRDNIYAVIKGFAVNNDGSKKMSYSSPSVDAQSEIVAEAQEIAGINPESIRYIEAHGTGTGIGDPVEVAALTKAFQYKTHKKNFCAIGSVKANIGHLDVAAGVAGLIKTALCVKNKIIPAQINFEKPNERIDFENSPFYVNTKIKPWDAPLAKAGVTSLGMGGTNAHVVLEEPFSNGKKLFPQNDEHPGIFVLSAKTETALKSYIKEMGLYIKQDNTLGLESVARTLQSGRREMQVRFSCVYNSKSDLLAQLDKADTGLFSQMNESCRRDVIFMFSGQGTQYPGMAKGLYENEPYFKDLINECDRIAKKSANVDVLKILFPSRDADYPEINKTENAQIAIFAVEYAVAKLLEHWGIKPVAIIGHSIGEFAGICLADGFGLEEAIELVLERGKCMGAMPEGRMLSVGLSEEEAMSYVCDTVDLAVVNGPRSCVLSGKEDSLMSIESALKEKNIFTRILHTSHGFHSHMMEQAAECFSKIKSSYSYRKMKIPVISTVTGNQIKDGEMGSGYFSRQIRQTVRFYDAVQQVIKQYNPVFLEIGPGGSLCSVLRHVVAENGDAIQVLPGIRDKGSERQTLYSAVGKIWEKGAQIQWDSLYKSTGFDKAPLPGYPFERKRHWLDAEGQADQKDDNISMQAHSIQRAPENIEQIRQNLRNIWKEELGTDKLSDHDHLFAIGGDSLIVIKIASKLSIFYPNTISVADLFVEDTIEKQSRRIWEKINDFGSANTDTDTDTGTDTNIDEAINILSMLEDGNG